MVEGFPQEHRVPPSAHTDRKHYPRLCRNPVRRKKSPARRRELFSLRKKRTAGIRLSAWQWFGSLYRLNPTPFSAPKKSPSNNGIPLAPLAAHLRIRRSRIPRCVVKRRTAETRGRASRSCPRAASCKAPVHTLFRRAKFAMIFLTPFFSKRTSTRVSPAMGVMESTWPLPNTLCSTVSPTA